MLKELPSCYLHEPYKYQTELKESYNFNVLTDYYMPIVDHKEAAKSAKDKIYKFKSKLDANIMSSIIKKHASRKNKATRRR